MAEPEPKASSFGFLVRKIGPLPAWAWGAIAVGGYYIYKQRQANQAAPAAATGDGTTPTGNVTENLTENITGPLSTTAAAGKAPAPRKKPAKGKHPPRRRRPPRKKPPPKRKAPARPAAKPSGRAAPAPARRRLIPVKGKPKPKPPPVSGGGGTGTMQTATAGQPGPLVSTVQQAGIITQPAYLDTSGAYQREPARVPRLAYPVVPSAPGQPPMSPPDEESPETQQAYAPMTAGSIYDTSATG